MKTYEELEREYYITNSPLHGVMATLIDIESERDDLYWQNDGLETELRLMKETTT